MDAIAALRTRRSIRAYKQEPIAAETLSAILDCGRLAPCGSNRQDWKFVLVTEEGLLKNIADLTNYGKHIAGAAACIAVFIGENAHTPEQDAASAAACMTVAAHALGVGSCWIGTPTIPNNFEEISALLRAPKAMTLHCLIALGIPAEEGRTEKRSLGQVAAYETYDGEDVS